MNIRLVPGVPLPRYAHVPGQTPHPQNDPDGHSYGQSVTPPTIDLARWRESQTYLQGLDLFNFGYYWEAHETWEGLWRSAGRGPTSDFFKGLIQLAVAGVKQRQGMPEGVKLHARRAAQLWRGVGEECFLGLSVESLIALADAIGREGWPSVAPTILPSEEK